MRIIAGKYKGIELKSSKSIRSTEGKVRKSLFDILGDLEGIRFLDLFAGCGSVGIEALSRGAGNVVFVEKDIQCCKDIENNLKNLGISKIKEAAIVLNTDVLVSLDSLAAEKQKFDIIFIDPPYYKDFLKKTLQNLSSCDILSPCTLIIAQHYKKDSLEESTGNLTLCKERRYGDTVLSFYQNK